MENENLTKKDDLDVLKSCYDYFFKLVPGIEKIAGGLNENPQAHVEDLADAFEGIAWLALAFIRTPDLHNIAIDTVYIYKTQRTVIDRLAHKDFSGVTDILENETLPMLNRWFDTLDEQYGYEVEADRAHHETT